MTVRRIRVVRTVFVKPLVQVVINVPVNPGFAVLLNAKPLIRVNHRHVRNRLFVNPLVRVHINVPAALGIKAMVWFVRKLNRVNPIRVERELLANPNREENSRAFARRVIRKLWPAVINASRVTRVPRTRATVTHCARRLSPESSNASASASSQAMASRAENAIRVRSPEPVAATLFVPKLVSDKPDARAERVTKAMGRIVVQSTVAVLTRVRLMPCAQRPERVLTIALANAASSAMAVRRVWRLTHVKRSDRPATPMHGVKRPHPETSNALARKDFRAMVSSASRPKWS